MKKNKYQLTITEDQAEVMWRALDLYARIGCGQLEEVVSLHRHHCSNVEAADESMKIAKQKLTGLVGNAAWSISNTDPVSDDFRTAFDLKTVIRGYLKHEEQNPPSWSQLGKIPFAHIRKV